mgnify:CR=1 FL=1
MINKGTKVKLGKSHSRFESENSVKSPGVVLEVVNINGDRFATVFWKNNQMGRVPLSSLEIVENE